MPRKAECEKNSHVLLMISLMGNRFLFLFSYLSKNVGGYSLGKFIYSKKAAVSYLHLPYTLSLESFKAEKNSFNSMFNSWVFDS